MKTRLSFGCFVLALPLLVWVDLACADRPARPVRYVEVAPDRQHLFVMMPRTVEDAGTMPAHGTAYHLESDGSLRELWRVEGWYAVSHLARGGRLLVREGPWASKPPEQELAVSFYVDGVEVARYTVSDLLQDVGNVQRSVSHYLWKSRRAPSRLMANGRYQLTTIEDVVFTFDIESGGIIDKHKIQE